MEVVLKPLAEAVAQICEAAAVVVIAAGAVAATVGAARRWRAFGEPEATRAVWVRFAASLLLALEFALAADICRTAVAPDWSGIGQLAVIALIRTFLSVFLTRDLEDYAQRNDPSGAAVWREMREKPR